MFSLPIQSSRDVTDISATQADLVREVTGTDIIRSHSRVFVTLKGRFFRKPRASHSGGDSVAIGIKSPPPPPPQHTHTPPVPNKPYGVCGR